MKQPKPWDQPISEVAYHLGAAIAYRNAGQRFLMGMNARIAASYIKYERRFKRTE